MRPWSPWPRTAKATWLPMMFAISAERLCLWYGDFQALFDVDLEIKRGIITSMIGPSGCGKTTFLRSVNRINERLGYVTTSGSIRVLGHDIYDDGVELVQVRKQVGNGLPASQPAASLRARQRPLRSSPAHDEVETLAVARGGDPRALSRAGVALGRGQGSTGPAGHRTLAGGSAEAVVSRDCCRSSPRSCSWTSPARRWTRPAPKPSRS